jgi:hypothetical protein
MHQQFMNGMMPPPPPPGMQGNQGVNGMMPPPPPPGMQGNQGVNSMMPPPPPPGMQGNQGVNSMMPPPMIGLNTPLGQNIQENGISPEFFGPPGKLDYMKDMHACQQLGIDPQGMDRNSIKAEILSKLTGESSEDMLNFYTARGPEDRQNDFSKMNELGLSPTNVREVNKTKIINTMMQNNQTSAAA